MTSAGRVSTGILLCIIKLKADFCHKPLQGSADAFGRLSKVRSELKKLLWTHPSGSLAGIADALEYLNQVSASDTNMETLTFEVS